MNLNKFYELILKDNGGSYNIVTGVFNPNTGYIVSLSDRELKVPLKEFNKDILKTFLIDHIDALCLDTFYLGAWVHLDTVYLDVSSNIFDKDRAIRVGKINKQLAIYDCENQVAIHL